SWVPPLENFSQGKEEPGTAAVPVNRITFGLLCRGQHYPLIDEAGQKAPAPTWVKAEIIRGAHNNHERAFRSTLVMNDHAAAAGLPRLLTGAGECDVPLGVGDIRADGDVPHGAAASAVHHDGAGACLGRGQQVAGADACLD